MEACGPGRGVVVSDAGCDRYRPPTGAVATTFRTAILAWRHWNSDGKACDWFEKGKISARRAGRTTAITEKEYDSPSRARDIRHRQASRRTPWTQWLSACSVLKIFSIVKPNTDWRICTSQRESRLPGTRAFPHWTRCARRTARYRN